MFFNYVHVFAVKKQQTRNELKYNELYYGQFLSLEMKVL